MSLEYRFQENSLRTIYKIKCKTACDVLTGQRAPLCLSHEAKTVAVVWKPCSHGACCIDFGYERMLRATWIKFSHIKSLNNMAFEDLHHLAIHDKDHYK